MRNAELARAFFTWSSITAQIILDGTISRRGALKAAAAFKHRHLKAAFNGWHLFSREQRDTLRKMRRATFRVLHHRLSMAFFTWSSKVTEEILLTEVENRAFQVLAKRLKSRMFYSWHGAAIEQL